MDTAIFLATTAAGAAIWAMKRKREEGDSSSSSSEKNEDGNDGKQLFLVDEHNQALPSSLLSDQEKVWCRAAYCLVMHEPPHLFYEPRDWSCTTVLLLRPFADDSTTTTTTASPSPSPLLQLPGGLLWKQESYLDSAIRHLKDDMAIDVCQPENCLHHLFTFPFVEQGGGGGGDEAERLHVAGVWGDFYECVYRGKVDELQSDLEMMMKREQKYSLVTMTLAEVQDALTHHQQTERKTGADHESQEKEEDYHPVEDAISFTSDTVHALKLYFQCQGDLRVQRRLLKGYSSADLEHYGLQSPQERAGPILRDFHDDQRQAAVDFTLRTDDGMAPRLLPQADLVLLGVSRAGKTPLSIFIAQTMGLKVANVPLVKELDPPAQLLVEHHKKHHRFGKDKVDPRRVFCLTLQPEYLQRLRTTRLRRELKKHQGGQGRSIYATLEYVQQDVQKAKDLCLTYGYTEIDVTGRAMEETASLILSKLRERFPDEATRAKSVHVL
jgi:regulator of PEP synthase PpsR (kinase-PPPase family)